MSGQPAIVPLGAEDFLRPRVSRWRSMGRIARANPVGVAAFVIILGLVLTALLASTLAPHGKTELGVGRSLEGPSRTYLLGTDRLGRDIFSRMLYGARLSLFVGFGSVAIGTVIGSALGLVSGYRGGWTDLVIQRFMDIMMSIPALLLAMVVVVALGTGSTNVIFAVAIILIPGAARVVRSVTLSLRARLFVEAAQASGASELRIIVRHILPTALDEIMVLASLGLGAAIILEAGLAFLGLGAQPPEPSWGGMLADGRTSFQTAPHMVYVPAAFISVTVLAAMILGDTVRDILDPRVRGSQGRVDL
jgi:ABC-type dipeptide/oligopeptide/nickel transport system permease subunit